MRKETNTVWRRVGSCFMGGLLAILPIVLTVTVVIWVTGFVEGFVGPNSAIGRSLASLGIQFASNRAIAYFIGWALVLGMVFVLGLVVETGAKRFLQRWVDAILKRIPLVGSIYGTSKQLVELFDQKDESELKAMSVVFCTFGQQGGPGVLALMPSPDRFNIDGHDYHVVIIPTAPVPFGGALVFMPAESVGPSDMSVDGLISIYVSMGVTTPQFLTKPPSP